MFPKAAQRGYAIGMNLSLSIQYHMLKCQTYHLPCQSPLLIAKKKGAHLYMETVPISDLPQPSISSELAEPFSIVSKPSHPFCVSASGTELSDYYSVIAKHRPAICSILSMFSDSYMPSDKATIVDLPPSLNDLYQPSNEELTYTELLEVCNQITCTISSAEVQLIERHTQTQSENAAWYSQHAGRITASKMKAVCSTDAGNPAQSLIDQVCYSYLHRFKSKATEWGCDHEDDVVAAYCEDMEKTHSNFRCKKTVVLLVRHTHSLELAQMVLQNVTAVEWVFWK